MYRKSIWNAIRLHLLFLGIFLFAGYKTAPQVHLLKIEEQTVHYKQAVSKNQSSSLKTVIPQSYQQPPPNKKHSQPDPSRTLPPIINKNTVKCVSDSSKKAPAAHLSEKHKSDLKDMAHKLLKDSEKWLQSLENTAAVCSEMQKNTMLVHVTSDHSHTKDSLVTAITSLIQESLQLPYPGILQLILEIPPPGEEVSWTVKYTDNENNKNYVLKEIRRISFEEIVKKYNFRKKTAFQIKLIGEPA